jgi:ribosomal protein S24E
MLKIKIKIFFTFILTLIFMRHDSYAQLIKPKKPEDCDILFIAQKNRLFPNAKYKINKKCTIALYKFIYPENIKEKYKSIDIGYFNLFQAKISNALLASNYFDVISRKPEDMQEVYLKYNIQPRWKFSRTDDYEKVATLFKEEDDKIIIRGFNVYVGTIDKIKEWIYDDKFKQVDLKYILDKDLKRYFENHVFEKPKKLDNDTILTTKTNKSRKKVVKMRSPPKVSPPKVSPPKVSPPKVSPPKVSPPLATTKKTSPKKTSPRNFKELIKQAKRNDNFIDLTI